MSDILNLAYLRIVRNRKNSLLFFLVLLLSFASAIVSVSVVGSIERTNAEYRLNTYGEWYLAIPYGSDRDREPLSEKECLDSIGTAQSVGTILSKDKIIGLGTIDETLIDIGRIRLDQGTFPSSADEIAIEADCLSALGYDYTLGQKITVSVSIPLDVKSTYDEEEFLLDSLSIEKTYTLCGVIHEYCDLWSLAPNINSIALNSAVVTEAAAAELLSEAEETLEKMFAEDQEISVRQPVYEYFMSVSEENRITAEKELKNYLSYSADGIRDGAPCVNSVAYQSDYDAGYDTFYMYIIALLTFISILCLEIIQLPSDTHSFSVLRSVGMSKGQLGLMQIFETIILGIPAILLGIPIGAGLTWLALRIMLYSGSVDIQVYTPYETLFFILGLWFAAIIISRLAIFVFTLRVPLIGRLQMNTSKSKGARLIRSGFIVLLLFVLSTGAIFAGMESLRPEYFGEYFSSCPSYVLWGKIDDTILLQSDVDAIEEIPGISEVYGFSELHAGLSFDGLSDKEVFLFVIDENDWTDVLDFGSDKTDFHNGEIVFISFPEDENEYQLPKGEAVLHIYNDNSKDEDPLADYTVSTRVRYIPQNANNRSVASILTPYTVVCSEQFIRDLLDTLPKGEKWSIFRIGEEFGYERVFVTADLNSDDLSTDITLAKICNERGIRLSNRRQVYLAYVQENVQSLIMLYFSGACVCIIALMIMWSNVSLEAKNEKHSFYIKRCIGMSKRQVDLNILGKTLLRCLSAFLLSWVMYISWAALKIISIYKGNGDSIDFISSVKQALHDFQYYNCTVGRIAIITLLGAALPIVLILYAKKDLRKDGDTK